MPSLGEILRGVGSGLKRAPIGDILTSGMAAAATPNVAGGGPTDTIRGIMAGVQYPEAMRRQRAEEEATNRARTAQAMRDEAYAASLGGPEEPKDELGRLFKALDDPRTPPEHLPAIQGRIDQLTGETARKNQERADTKWLEDVYQKDQNAKTIKERQAVTDRQTRNAQGEAAMDRQRAAMDREENQRRLANPPANTPAELAVAATDPSKTPEQRQNAEAALRRISQHEISTRPPGAQASEAAMEDLAQSLAKGDLTRLRDVMSLRSSNAGAALQVFSRARKLNPKFSTAEIDRKIKMEEDLMKSAPGSVGGQLQSFGTFLEHAGAASEAVQGIRQNSSPLVNRPMNWWKKNASGDPNFQAFMVSLEPVRKEFESFLLGGRALYGDDRMQAEKILSDNSSPAQIQAALKQMGHTAKARFREINFRYKRTIGHDIEDPFPPEAVNAATRIGVDLGVGKSAGATPAGAPVSRIKILKVE